MILYIFFIHFLSAIVVEAQMLDFFDSVFGNKPGLERWPREVIQTTQRPQPYEDKPPACDQRYHTEATHYAVIILSKTSGHFLCMGSLLGPQYALTVRECLLRDDLHDLLVMAGYVTAWWGRNAQVKKVEEIYRSEDDLAILKLSRQFRFSKSVKPIKLSNFDMWAPHTIYGTQYGVVGFNRAPWDVPGEPMPKTAFYELRYATLITDPDDIEKCKQAYADVIFNDTTMFCTYENTTYCWGNLGSPTVVYLDEQSVQMGIVVRAYCDENRLPNLHLRIDAYEGWIRSNAEARQIRRRP